MGIQLSDLVENIVGKEEIARYDAFKSCLLLMRQNEYLWTKGLNLVQYGLVVTDLMAL